jgi:hypothetical protein
VIDSAERVPNEKQVGAKFKVNFQQGLQVYDFEYKLGENRFQEG